MSIVLMLVLATGDAGAQAQTANSAATVAAVSPAVSSQTAPAAQPPARSPKELRMAVADALRRLNGAKGADRAPAIKALASVYSELGRDRELPKQERLRLGTQARTRLARYATQLHYESLHPAAQKSTDAQSGVQTGAAGGSAAENLDDLVDLIQKTIAAPGDWVLAQRIGNGGPGGAGAGQLAGGGAGGGQAGGGNALDQATEANGEALVDMIQQTINPPSWDVNGGPGSIRYFNNYRALVVRQTGEVQDDLQGLMNGLRR